MGIRTQLKRSISWMFHPFGRTSVMPRRQSLSRGFDGAAGGRLNGDWMAGGTSADAEIQGNLPKLRNNARDMVRNSAYAAQVQRLFRDNIIGPAGIQLQMKVPKLRGDGLDENINTSFESAWRQWCRSDSCDVSGMHSMREIEWLCAMSLVDSGEFLVRFVRQPFGRENKIPLALELIESDQLDLNYVGPLKSPDNHWRMGIEVDKWKRPVTYAILTAHPGDYLATGQNAIHKRRHELIPASDICHVFFRNRVGQNRGYPVLSPIMGDSRQTNKYVQAVTIRARAAASVMGFIQTPDGELRGDAVEGEGENAQRVTDFEPGVFKQLNPGESVIVPDIKAPDNQFEMFMKDSGRRFAAGTGVSYSTVTRDAGEASYSSERQQYLQDQDAWSVLQAMVIDQLMDKIIREWIPAAVLSGAVIAKDFYVRPNRYYDAVSWQPRGWAWVDPKKEAEAYVVMEQAGYTSKIRVCGMQGNDYESILKDRARQRALEAQYNDSVPIGELFNKPGEPPPDSEGNQ